MVGRWLLSWSIMLALATPVAAKEVEPLRLTASSPWWLNYDDDSCTMKRVFGADKDMVGLIMEVYSPGAGFYLSLTGRPFRNWTTEEKVKYRFDPAGEDRSERYFSVRAANHDSGILLRSTVGIATAPASVSESPASKHDTKFMIDEDRELQVNELFIAEGRNRPIVLETQSMGAPLKALRKCANSLSETWGLDPKVKLVRPPLPLTSPSSWINSNDYPPELLRQFERAVVHFRLDVDKAGNATSCHIQRAIGDKRFENTVCANMMAMAKFYPALDEAGAPALSAFVSTVSFVIGEPQGRK